MVKTLRGTERRKVLATDVDDGPNSPLSDITSVPVRVVMNPRFVANDSHVGDNAKRGVVLGVVDAAIVVGLNEMGKGQVMGVRLDGQGLVSQKIRVLVSRLRVGGTRTGRLLRRRNSIGGTLSTCGAGGYVAGGG